MKKSSIITLILCFEVILFSLLTVLKADASSPKWHCFMPKTGTIIDLGKYGYVKPSTVTGKFSCYSYNPVTKKVSSKGIGTPLLATELLDSTGKVIYEGDTINDGNADWKVVLRSDHNLLGWYAQQTFSNPTGFGEVLIGLLDINWTIK